MKLVIATHNPKKTQEMHAILDANHPALQLLTLNDFPGIPEPEETGENMRENAVIKASSALNYTGLWCVADDGGLEIDVLGGQPGLYSKRFAGENTPFSEKMQIILEKMRNVPQNERTARYRCAIALAIPGEPIRVFEKTCEGNIAFELRGLAGFGYDPIFWIPEFGCTMAELSPDQKNEISHRGKALRELGSFLDISLGKSC